MRKALNHFQAMQHAVVPLGYAEASSCFCMGPAQQMSDMMELYHLVAMLNIFKQPLLSSGPLALTLFQTVSLPKSIHALHGRRHL